ncbi:Pogo transposable element with KRAB domain [Dirofilaria immitis]
MVDDIATGNLEATISRKRKPTPIKSGRRNNNNNMMMIGNDGDNNCGTESVVAQKGRKLKQYVLEEKLDIIDYAKIIGNRAAGREFNVAESSIREWRKNEQRLRSMFETTPERSRLDGGGRRPVSDDLEKSLLQYVTSKSDNETALTWHDIKEKANALWKDICDRNPEYNDRGFTANMGWVARFVRRNNITLQVTNSTSTIAPKLVNSSDDNNTNIIDNSINRSDNNSLCCNSTDMMANSSCISPSTVSRISDLTVANTNMSHRNDITKTNTTAITTTTSTEVATPIISTTVPVTTSTIAVATISNSTVSAKKRRKNFTPKKIVPNDIVCLATNNRTQ